MKVLIIKIGSIGDVIMSLPLIEEIKRHHPSSEITWMVGNASYDIVSRISGIRVIKIDEYSLLGKKIPFKILEIVKTWKKIGLFNSFDLILNGHSDPRYKLLALPFSTSKNYNSFHRPNSLHSNLIPGRHHTNEYLRLFHKNDSLKIENISFPKIDFGKEMPKEKRKDKTIAISPGGAKTSFNDDKLRRWPIEQYVELASLLIENGFKVVLFGGPSDVWTIEYFKHLPVENSIAKGKLIESIYELSSMHCLVTHDCGPMHFSILAQIPVVSLFGPTNPWEKYPKTIKSIFLWGGENLPCRPCYDGRYYSNCASNICLKSITSQNVLDKVTEILEN
ncbi:MAG: glycosyltransferase family 9 protein [Cytophagales bacterium]|nr:glycosyltransferase family 9 protein [Cytophagales bacterium]